MLIPIEFAEEDIRNKGWWNFCMDNNIFITTCDNHNPETELDLSYNSNGKELSGNGCERFDSISNYFDIMMVLHKSIPKREEVFVIINFGNKCDIHDRYEELDNNKEKEINIVLNGEDRSSIKVIILENSKRYIKNYSNCFKFSLIWGYVHSRGGKYHIDTEKTICISLVFDISQDVYLFWMEEVWMKNSIYELCQDISEYKFKNIPVIFCKNMHQNNVTSIDCLFCLKKTNFILSKKIKHISGDYK